MKWVCNASLINVHELSPHSFASMLHMLGLDETLKIKTVGF